MVIRVAATTVAGVVRERALQRPDRLACGFLADGEADLRALTYAELDSAARRVASLLGDRLAPGGRAMLVYEPGLDFVTAFLGCLYAGVVAVPVLPPAPPRAELGAALVERVLADSGAEALATTSALHGTASGLGRRLATTPWILTDSGGDPGAWRDPGIGGHSLALLQYTSGSTGMPRGVLLTHGNLLANLRAQSWSLGIPDDATMVSWLPMYHDMGLIGGLLCPLYRGSACYLLSPLHVMQRPLRWPWAISRFRAVISGGPNFAYDLCARLASDADLAGMDLSCWEVAFCGAEPIRAPTMRRFAAAFAPAGFRPSRLKGCYGLAEASLLVTGADPGGQTLLVDRAELDRGRVREVAPGAAAGIELVSSGRAYHEYDLRIVDLERAAEVGPGQVGEIWVRGPSVALGYWHRPEETEAVFGGTLASGGQRYLRTGDLGFVHGGWLYVTGRIKDLLIVRGRSIHPHDIEDAVQAADRRLWRGCGAAFAVETADGEGVALLQEVTTRDPEQLAALARAAREAVLRTHQVQLAEVYLVARRSVLRTSSGKVRRLPSRDALRGGRMTVLYEDRA